MCSVMCFLISIFRGHCMCVASREQGSLLQVKELDWWAQQVTPRLSHSWLEPQQAVESPSCEIFKDKLYRPNAVCPSTTVPASIRGWSRTAPRGPLSSPFLQLILQYRLLFLSVWWGREGTRTSIYIKGRRYPRRKIFWLTLNIGWKLKQCF